MLAPAILILLVEDDAMIGLSLQTTLEDAGFGIQYVESGVDAVGALSSSDLPAGLITDINLGEGPDGWAVARRAREASPLIPVVYMSGDSAHEHSAYGVPDSVIIQKPFALAQIVTAISALLNAVPPTPAD